MDKEFDFAGFSTLNLAMEEIYGAKGERLLGIPAGKVYSRALCNRLQLEGKELLLKEEKCLAVGDDCGQFAIQKPAMG